MPAAHSALRALAAAAFVSAPALGEFTCGESVNTNSGVARYAMLADCEANLAVFNADPIWGLWAVDSPVLFDCAPGGFIVSQSCAVAQNHLTIINLGINGIPGFACTDEGALATVDCGTDLPILNGYINFVPTTAPPPTTEDTTTAATPPPEEPVAEDKADGVTTTTEEPELDRNNGAVGTAGKKGKKGGTLGPPLDLFGPDPLAESKKGKKKGKSKKGKKGGWRGGVHGEASSIAIVAGVMAGCVFAVGTVWRARSIAASKMAPGSPARAEAGGSGLERSRSGSIWRFGALSFGEEDESEEYATPLVPTVVSSLKPSELVFHNYGAVDE